MSSSRPDLVKKKKKNKRKREKVFGDKRSNQKEEYGIYIWKRYYAKKLSHHLLFKVLHRIWNATKCIQHWPWHVKVPLLFHPPSTWCFLSLLPKIMMTYSNSSHPFHFHTYIQSHIFNGKSFTVYKPDICQDFVFSNFVLTCNFKGSMKKSVIIKTDLKKKLKTQKWKLSLSWQTILYCKLVPLKRTEEQAKSQP